MPATIIANDVKLTKQFAKARANRDGSVPWDL
jgi:hypothetical protein